MFRWGDGGSHLDKLCAERRTDCSIGNVFPRKVRPFLGGGFTPAAPLFGVNLSGAEGGTIPGTINFDYTLSTLPNAAYYATKGMGLVRLPFRWERIQPTLGGALDTAHVNWLTSFLQQSPNFRVMLDVHNFGQWWDGSVSRDIGGVGGPTQAQFNDLWTRLANQFKSYPNAEFGIMNEPFSYSAAAWATIAQSAIAAIRATGASNKILVPGTSFTGAHSWITSGNAAAWVGFSDPNFLFEMHQYFDSDSSGTSATAVSGTIGSERLAAATTWLRTNGYRGFLGEFGAANNATMLAALADCVSFMRTNRDVWPEWTYWAGGPWLGSYIYSIEPSAGVDAPQMTTLLPFLS